MGLVEQLAGIDEEDRQVAVDLGDEIEQHGRLGAERADGRGAARMGRDDRGDQVATVKVPIRGAQGADGVEDVHRITLRLPARPPCL